MSSESPRKRSKRRVCLICGSYTSLMVNILEPRNGPNIIDVIHQKFGMQPLNDDNGNKFLCYSCNNWLINWHSLQNKNEASGSKPSGKSKRFNQSIPEEHHPNEAMAVPVDQYSETSEEILRLRSHLGKYFYYPKRLDNTKITDSAIIQTKCFKSNRSIRKYRPFRSRFITKKCFHLRHQQRKQRRTVRPYANKSSKLFRMRRTKNTYSTSTYLSHIISQRRMLKQRSSQTIVVNPYVVSRLKQLGTTVISCEGTSASTANDLSRCIITNNTKKIDQSVIRSNNTNDILIAFNTVLQEVFPVDLSENQDVVDDDDDISKIFERIPKSLSITLA